jgi:hypothetical protein
MDDQRESTRIARLLIPSQLIRAILMSAVLYPILPFLSELSFGMQFLFMGSLMLIYADIACAVPFDKTVRQIYRAIRRKWKVAYVTRRWRMIAILLSIMPRFVFDRI